MVTKYGLFSAPCMGDVLEQKYKNCGEGEEIAYRACTVGRLFEFLCRIDPCNSIDASSYDRYRQLRSLDRLPNCQDQGLAPRLGRLSVPE